ncbi:MAG: hypothetical protein AAB502_11560 [Chloroflexota bacterium]
MLAAAGCAAARAADADSNSHHGPTAHGHPDSDACTDANTLARAIARSCGSAYRYAILDALANSYPRALAHSSLCASNSDCGVRSSGDANHSAIPNARTGCQTDGNPSACLWPWLEGSEHALELDRAESAVD